MVSSRHDLGRTTIFLPWLFLVTVSPGLAGEPSSVPDFEKTVAAILIKNCVICHNGTEAKGGLDLTRAESLRQGGKSGPVLLTGKPEESYLIERVTAGSMPPPKQGRPLAPEEVAHLSAWIKAGAPWPAGRVLSPFELTTERRAGYDWWSLQPLAHPAVPPIGRPGWVRNPIDAFILRKLEQHGLTPASEVNKATYLRRAKLDLLGLPPTPDESDAFVADTSPAAYEKLLDRLLASPHYGERWGRHWLDVVRFGESDGFEHDKLRPHAWRYRDYVIHSFNEDKPYPQFIREQLAGDVLQPLTHDGLVATGFLVAGPWDEIQNVGKSKLERQRTHEEQLEELVGTVTQTFLGLTVNCARCHDHKFDPVPQTDYYRVKAVFDGVDHGNRLLFKPEEAKAHEQWVTPVRTRAKELRTDLEDLYQRTWEELPARLESGVVTSGRFGQGLDARRAPVAVPSRPAFQRPPLSIECWAKVQNKDTYHILVANGLKESSTHWELYSHAPSGEFSVYLPGCTPAEIRSGVEITDGQWHYLGMSFDGSRLRLYVDGKLVRQAALTRQRSEGIVGFLYFGAYPPQGLGCAGVVDEVRISRVVRTMNQLPEGPFTADASTIGLWHFDAPESEGLKDLASQKDPATHPGIKPRYDALVAELKQKEAELVANEAPMTYSGVRRQPEATYVYLRGDLQKPGPQVTPGGLSPLRRLPADLGLPPDAPEGERRQRFAAWVAHPDNPLTARVLVNRIWQYHFGQGLLDTPNDFGFNGGRPSHPQLLDWLARDFIASGWSIKQLHRRIMLSATYRQAAQPNPRAAALDSDNRLLWRYPTRRLEGEIVRDAMLAVSGELNPRLGGPSFRPFTVTEFNTHFYHLFDSDAPEFNRRTVYRIQVNTAKSPLLDALDCPAPSLPLPRRRTTTTPLQALALMNDSFVLRQADRFAQRVRRTVGDDLQAQITLAYRLALGRLPRDEERDALAKLAREHGLDSACWVLLNASEFLYVP